jgi:TRAP-type uncharacterized transport system substrate-binding protein
MSDSVARPELTPPNPKPPNEPKSPRKPLRFLQKIFQGEFLLLTRSEQTRVALMLLALMALLLWFLFRFIEPPPPKVVRISTGSATGAYTLFAKQYAVALKKHGVTLEIVNSAGSVENLQRLDDPKQKIDLAFVQGGVSTAALHPRVEALASVAYEPIWCFYNKKRFDASKPHTQPPTRLSDLAGHLLAIDAPGSGVHAAASQLLEMNKVPTQGAQISSLGGMQAIDAVLAGTLEAAILVAAVDSPAVQKALSEEMGLMNFENTDAYVRLLPWVAKVTLPKGVAKLDKNLPREDVTLIAATANLVGTTDLHRAIMFLMLDVASTVHKKPAATNAQTEFPSERNLDYSQSDESKRFFKSGKPFLEEYLPFWMANLVERMLLTLVPVIAIGLPLMRMIPAFFSWRGYAQLIQLYDEVIALEQQAGASSNGKAKALSRLQEIDAQLSGLRLSAEHHMNVYNLKSHIDLVKARLTSG